MGQILGASLSGRRIRNSFLQRDIECAQKVEIPDTQRSLSPARTRLW